MGKLNKKENIEEGYITGDKFKIFCPVEFLEKSNKKDDEYEGCYIKGLAATEDRDLQGEIIKSQGMDISALKEGRGIFNYDHKDGPENVIGKVEDADISSKGLQVEGYLFKDHDRGKAFLQILKSLKPKDKHRVQMSVEGKIIERNPYDSKIINKAAISKVALTLDPVNPKTYTELVKSLFHEKNKEELVKNEKEETKEQEDKEKALGEIELSSSLLMRLLEWAKEEAMEDVEMHKALENIKKLYAKEDMLDMKDYEKIIPKKDNKDDDKKEMYKSAKARTDNLIKSVEDNLKNLIKMLQAGTGYTGKPGGMTGGSALQKESIIGSPKKTTFTNKKKKKKKKK